MSEDRQERFTAYVEALAEVIGHADRAEPLRDYCRGLLLPGERKSVEPIAAVTAPARVSAKHQSLLHFVANAPWSNERVLSRIQELILPVIEGVKFEARDDHTLALEMPRSLDLNGVFATLNASNIRVRSMRNESNRLEELFVRLTGDNKKVLADAAKVQA